MTALRQEEFLPTGLTVDEFLEWAEATDGRYELVDGEVVSMSPPSQTHGLIFAEIAGIIRDHLRKSGGRCRVVLEPGVKTRIRARHNYRIPELGVICNPPVAGTQMVAEPILIVEVLSPGNAKDTWTNVWAYAANPAVQEILVIESVKVKGWLLRRQADHSWPEDPEPILPDGLIVLNSIDLSTPLIDAYATTPFAHPSEPDGSPRTD
jgi:Uma2 family endonuclease